LRSTWWSAEVPLPVPASDVASEIVWDSRAGVAVFDHSGRLAFSNPAFRTTPALADLVDRRGYLSHGRLEHLRREVVHSGHAAGPHATTSPSADLTLDVEVLPLKVAQDWTAMIVRCGEPDADPAADSLTLGLLAHELRGPLLVANESLEVLTQAAASSPTELRDAVTRQGRSLARLTALVQGLSDLSLARGLDRTRQSWSSVDLAQLVEEVACQYQDLASAAGLELTVSVEQNVPPIEGHPELLARAIANLVDNALKYAAAPGPLRLQFCRRGSLAVVEVADNGPGIPPEHQAAIFTEFFRLPQARGPQVPGTGLGLPVSRRVAQAHGGRLSLESQPEIGSVFKLSFLLDRRPLPNVGEKAAAARRGRFL